MHRRLPYFFYERVVGRDVVRMALAGKELVVLNNPALIEKAVERDPGNLVRIPFQEEHRFAGDTVAIASGDTHGRRRRLVEPLFSEGSIDRYAAAIVAEADACSARWTGGSVVDVEAEMEDLGADAMARVLFGDDFEGIREPLREFHRVSRVAVTRTINPLAPILWRLPLPVTRRFDAARRRFQAAVDPLVAARREGDRGDLLGALVAARSDDDRLTVAQARDEAWTYYSQGAPGVAVTWVWWLLGTNPAAEEHLHAELDARLQGRPPSAADLANLEYTRAVVLEALRLYAPGLGLLRRAAKTFALDGLEVRAGRWIFVPFFVLHRDARFWPAPATFRPERWLDERAREVPRYAYLPFAAGPRRCPARNLALLLCTAIVAAVASKWRLHPTRAEVELTVIPFLRPRDGMPMRLEERRMDGT